MPGVRRALGSASTASSCRRCLVLLLVLPRTAGAAASAAAASATLHAGFGGSEAASRTWSRNAAIGGGAAAKGPAPFKPLEEKSMSTAGFPSRPPIELAAGSGGGQNASGPTFFRLMRDMWSITGHDLTLADRAGQYVYATKGQIWTLHSHTDVFRAASGQRVALISRVNFAFRTTFELCVYEPPCQGQEPYEVVDGAPVYTFARLTRRISFWKSFSLERHLCDGSLTTVWEITSRYWFALKVYLDFWKPGGGDRPVGSFDQSYFFDRTLWHNSAGTFDVWISGGADTRLFAVTAVAIDMTILEASKADEHHKNSK